MKKLLKKKTLDIFADRRDDGNCLFWSVALAYLNVCYAVSPPRTNLVARLQKLIQEPDNASQSVSFLEVPMKSFLKTLNPDFIFNKEFENLIQQLRKHTVNFICQHKEAYSDFITDNFDEYLKGMSLSGTWGGEMEITALCSLLGCDIHVCNKTSGTTLLFKPNIGSPVFTVEDRATLHLSWKNNHFYCSFPEVKVQRERRQSFYTLPSAGGFSESFFEEIKDKNDEVNPEDPQPGIKFSR